MANLVGHGAGVALYNHSFGRLPRWAGGSAPVAEHQQRHAETTKRAQARHRPSSMSSMTMSLALEAGAPPTKLELGVSSPLSRARLDQALWMVPAPGQPLLRMTHAALPVMRPRTGTLCVDALGRGCLATSSCPFRHSRRRRKIEARPPSIEPIRGPAVNAAFLVGRDTPSDTAARTGSASNQEQKGEHL